MTPRVEMVGVSKRFGATAALTDVSFDLRPGLHRRFEEVFSLD